ncbi:MAG: type II toxin-antitoxin system VapC family toxin [Candidatus Binataceae bacterium]
MTQVMLDTSTCIFAMRRSRPEVRRRLESIGIKSAAISAIVAAELWTGVMKSTSRERAEFELRDFLRFVEVLEWPIGASPIYAQLRVRLEAAGRTIGAMDMLIAAHALYEGVALVTDNTAEFGRIPDLALENWVRR